MSFNVSKWAWQQQLSANTKYVLLALADYADESGVCFPSQRRLADKCGLSRSTINVHLQQLVQKKLISIEHQYNQAGYRKASLYRLAINQSLKSRQRLSQSQTLLGPNSRQQLSNQLTHHHNQGCPPSGQRKSTQKSALKDAL